MILQAIPRGDIPRGLFLRILQGCGLLGKRVSRGKVEEKAWSRELDGDRDGFSVYGPRAGRWAAAGPAFTDINSHRLKDRSLGLLDRPADSVNARKILTIGVKFASLAFNRNRVRV